MTDLEQRVRSELHAIARGHELPRLPTADDVSTTSHRRRRRRNTLSASAVLVGVVGLVTTGLWVVGRRDVPPAAVTTETLLPAPDGSTAAHGVGRACRFALATDGEDDVLVSSIDTTRLPRARRDGRWTTDVRRDSELRRVGCSTSRSQLRRLTSTLTTRHGDAIQSDEHRSFISWDARAWTMIESSQVGIGSRVVAIRPDRVIVADPETGATVVTITP